MSISSKLIGLGMGLGYDLGWECVCLDTTLESECVPIVAMVTSKEHTAAVSVCVCSCECERECVLTFVLACFSFSLSVYHCSCFWCLVHSVFAAFRFTIP